MKKNKTSFMAQANYVILFNVIYHHQLCALISFLEIKQKKKLNNILFI